MMPFRRISIPLAVVILVIIGILAAYWMGQVHLLRPDDLAKQVAAHYGDPHAQITGVKFTQTDNPPHSPMYLITLSGHFHKNTHMAHYLSFSALADKMYVWDIRGYDQPGQELWWDGELAPRR